MTRGAFTRREFIRVSGLAAGGFAALGLPTCGGRDDTKGASDAEGIKGKDGNELPGLGGAPNTHEGRTIAAFCDTVIPGAYRDPKGAPGAIDTTAVGLFFDPDLPAATFVPLLVALLDARAKGDEGADFAAISPEAREAVLDKTLQEVEVVTFAVELAKLAYYSTEEAAAHLGYPGPNAGYVFDPDFSFGIPMAREITTDGNLA